MASMSIKILLALAFLAVISPAYAWIHGSVSGQTGTVYVDQNAVVFVDAFGNVASPR